MLAVRITRNYMMNIFPDMKNSRIGCVIMASGLGVRFGGNKLMADFGGKPMVSHILESATACFTNVVVVTRNTGVVELCNANNIRVVFHDLPYRSDTIRLGIEALGGSVDGACFCLADQPFLSVTLLRKLIAFATEEPNIIWRSSSDGVIGSPAYFPKKYFDELSSLPQDKGGSYVCKKHPETVKFIDVENPLELRDIDTRETYEELLPLARNLNFWNDFLKSDKKHLFITGHRGSGKTTLINRLQPLIGNGTSGLTSFAVQGIDVRLVNNRTKEEIIIGRYIPDDFVKTNRMTPDISVFDTKGIAFVEELIDSNNTWVTIDEIGYLEEFSYKYQEAIRSLLETKRVVAVVRKDDLNFLNELINRSDAFVLDLDICGGDFYV